MSLIRYPGSKQKLAAAILESFPDEFTVPLFISADAHYIEPFFGSGAIGFSVMRRMHRGARVTIADMDIGIVSLWKAVRDSPRELSRQILNFVPTVDAFYEFKKRDGEYTNDVDTGFRKLALHRTSFSGFGYKAGGPLGGSHQHGDYSVGCRWNADRMVLVISALHKCLRKFENLSILHQCVFTVLENIEAGPSTFVYLDPPYYEKGEQLYKHGFSPSDHNRLASVLRGNTFCWAASYDDHPEIRRLYEGCKFRQLNVRYSNAVCRDPQRPKNHEILIQPLLQYAQ